MSKCNYFMPKNFPWFEEANGDSCECLCQERYAGDHLCLIKTGQYVRWRFDYHNGCSCPDDDCQCFIWDYVSESEAGGMLALKGDTGESEGLQFVAWGCPM